MDQVLTVYWRASRCRLDRWSHSLHAISERSWSQPLPFPSSSDKSHGADQQPRAATWLAGAAAIVDEVLVSEILTRVVAAVTVAHDEQHGRAESAPVGRNIFEGHLDSRRRALALVASPAHRGSPHAKRMVALHGQCDRWIDLLLAYLAPLANVAPLATSPARVRDFEYDAQHHLRSAISSEVALTMILAGMNSSLMRLSVERSPNTDLNFELAAALVSCFPPAAFDTFGLPRSLWFERLQNAPTDAAPPVDDWWDCQPDSEPGLRSPRWHL
jgi:hypothetical protein